MTVRILAEESRRWRMRFRGWGLSLLVGEDLLFDTYCDGRRLARSFGRFGITPRQIRTVVISHDHWDHTGGLAWLLCQNPAVTVYVGRGFSRETKHGAAGAGAEVVEVADPIQLTEGVWSTGEMPFSYKGADMVEQALVLERGEGVAVLTGCSHPGIEEVLRRAVSLPHGLPLRAVIGGFHLMNHTAADAAAVAGSLQQTYDLDLIAPCHCTGPQGCSRFRKVFRERYRPVQTGSRFEL